ncbi:MAG: methionyl-tRNA formyltransferase [Sphaerobacteraceae bacterium]|nr:MAG: methionyl-tRNA formyltransferase [Sphaerobacteraceae bacterium]
MTHTATSIKVVFLGSPTFAVPSLNAMVHSPKIDVPLVITQPDRPAGRGKTLTAPPVKEAALSHGLPILQPETLRDPATVETIRETAPDVLIVVSYGEILRRNVLELAPNGCLNVHPSLLPRYRGSIPIQATILNGDDEGGVSFIKLVKAMDAGPIVHQIPVPLSGDETSGELFDRLSEAAAEALPDVVVNWVDGRIEAREQDHAVASYTRELRKADAQIDWSSRGVDIERHVRAMNPWPRAWSTIAGKRVAIDRVSLISTENVTSAAGTLQTVEGWPAVSTRDGVVRIEKLTPAGKKQMTGQDWLRGTQELVGEVFDSPESAAEPLIFTR